MPTIFISSISGALFIVQLLPFVWMLHLPSLNCSFIRLKLIASRMFVCSAASSESNVFKYPFVECWNAADFQRSRNTPLPTDHLWLFDHVSRMVICAPLFRRINPNLYHILHLLNTTLVWAPRVPTSSFSPPHSFISLIWILFQVCTHSYVFSEKVEYLCNSQKPANINLQPQQQPSFTLMMRMFYTSYYVDVGYKRRFAETSAFSSSPPRGGVHLLLSCGKSTSCLIFVSFHHCEVSIGDLWKSLLHSTQRNDVEPSWRRSNRSSDPGKNRKDQTCLRN